MATQTKTTSGNNTIYTIADVSNNTVTITQVATPGLQKTLLFSSSANGLLIDGQQMMAQLLLLLATQLTP